MYYVNHRQIEEKLQIIPLIVQACHELRQAWDASKAVPILAQERALHLAVEAVTDVGSLFIDGFLMRDASSYEDIIEILRGENVFPAELAEPLLELVKLRKPLVQEYVSFPRDQMHPLLDVLPDVLASFAESAEAYLRTELGE